MTDTVTLRARLIARLRAGERCQACVSESMGGRPRRALSIIQFTVDDTAYLLPVCERCSTEFDCSMDRWVRLAEVTDPPWLDTAADTAPAASARSGGAPPSVTFEGLRKGTVIDHDAEAARERLENAARAAAAAQAAKAAAVNDSTVLLYDGKQCYLTLHARERMEERDVTLHQIAALLRARPIRRPGSRPGTVVIVNNTLQVVLDQALQCIVTVARRNEDVSYVYRELASA